MGRAAKAKKENERAEGKRTKLPREVFFEMQAKYLQVNSIVLEAKNAADEYTKRAQAAHQAAQEFFQSVADAHGLDKSKNYTFDTSTCELIEQETTT